MAIHGVEEIMEEIKYQVPDARYLFVPCGTGATAAGIINRATEKQFVYVVNSMKNPSLENEITSLLRSPKENWKLLNGYHQGGFAKVNHEVVLMMEEFKNRYKVLIDPIYNAKMMIALTDLCKRGVLDRGSIIVAIHTGGLQGLQAYNYSLEKRNQELVSW